MRPWARTKHCQKQTRHAGPVHLMARRAGLTASRAFHWAAASWFLLAASPAAAARLNLEFGRSYMDSTGTTAAFVDVVFDQRRIGDSRFGWSPDVSIGWIDGRNIKRYDCCRYSTNESAWLIAGGIRLHYGGATDWYRPLFFSFQPALNSGRTQALSSAYEFVSTIGWQGRHANFQIRHVSNGALHKPNRGETMALMGLTFTL